MIFLNLSQVENILLSLHQKEAEEKISILLDSHMWDRNKINFRAWLNNFEDKDKDLACQLVLKYQFISEVMVKRCVQRGFDDFLRVIDYKDAVNVLSGSTESLKIVPILGENPSPTDSGYFLARVFRQTFNLNDDDFLLPEELENDLPPDVKYLVFVDDCIGSGNQFCKMWEKRIEPFLNGKSVQVFYLCILATPVGLGRARANSQANINAVYTIDLEHGIPHPFYKQDRSKLKVFDNLLVKYSQRYKIDADYKVDQVYGFCGMGCCVSFFHSVPDFSLPIFWAKGDNWHPLHERT